jgi:hypothetical protein
MEKRFKTICIRFRWLVQKKFSIETQVITQILTEIILIEEVMVIINHHLLIRPQLNILEHLVQARVLI